MHMPPPPPQNVLVVVMDDIGKDFLAPYGLNQIPATTPTIDSFAAGGILFTHFYANPNCSPTRASLHTGLYPYRSGIGEVIKKDATESVPDDGTQLCDLLPSNYTSGLFGKWHLGNFITSAGLCPADIGYDHYSVTERSIRVGEQETYWLFEKSEDGIVVTETVYATTDATDEAIAWINAQPGPWFCNVSYHSAHIPRHVAPQHLQSTADPSELNPTVRLKSMIEAMDTELGRLWTSIDTTETTLILVGDNGSAKFIQQPYQLGQHKGTVYEGGINAPLLVFGDAVKGSLEGTQDATLIGAVDLYETIVNLTGDRVPIGIPHDSCSFWGRIVGRPLPVRNHVLSEMYGPNYSMPTPTEWCRAIRDSQYKLISDEVSGVEEFYDLSADPYEVNDLMAGALDPAQQAALDALRALLVTYAP